VAWYYSSRRYHLSWWVRGSGVCEPFLHYLQSLQSLVASYLKLASSLFGWHILRARSLCAVWAVRWGPRQTHPFLKLIWFSCVWTIWKERNNPIFNHTTLELHQLLDKVKLLSFTWLTTEMTNIAYTYISGGATSYFAWASLCNCFLVDIWEVIFIVLA